MPALPSQVSAGPPHVVPGRPVMTTADALSTIISDPQAPVLFISPHLDDVVLSAGGLLSSFRRRLGLTTVVATVFAGSPPETVESPFASTLLAAWNLGIDPMAARRAEDAKAMQILGSVEAHLPLFDAVFRTDAGGNILYPTASSIFCGKPARSDPARTSVGDNLARLMADIRPSLVLAPMGIGNHVDHLLVHSAVALCRQPLPDILWYEDLPYGIRKLPSPLDERLTPIGVSFEEPDWLAKSDAVSTYRSQLAALWPNGDAIDDLKDYAYRVGDGRLAERIWCPPQILSRLSPR